MERKNCNMISGNMKRILQNKKENDWNKSGYANHKSIASEWKKSRVWMTKKKEKKRVNTRDIAAKM